MSRYSKPALEAVANGDSFELADSVQDVLLSV